MNHTRSASKSSLFLMELIIAILFFSLASGICIQLFAKAHTTSVHSSDVNQAALCAQSAADLWKGAANQDFPSLLEGAHVAEDGTVTVNYNPDWKPVLPEEDALYRMEIHFTAFETLEQADISIVKSSAGSDGGSLFALQTVRYSPEV